MPDELITKASDVAGESPRYDTTVAHPARVYNYWLGYSAKPTSLLTCNDR